MILYFWFRFHWNLCFGVRRQAIAWINDWWSSSLVDSSCEISSAVLNNVVCLTRTCLYGVVEAFYDVFLGDLLDKSQNAPVLNPTMHNFVTEMCTHVHISVTKWCIMGYLFNAFWDLWALSLLVGRRRQGMNLSMRDYGIAVWRINQSLIHCNPQIS